jgi:hypothetical protein
VPAELTPLLADGHQVGISASSTIEALRRADATLPDPTRIWRVPARHASVLAAHPAVLATWGHPAPAPPPDDPADRPPTTPDFSADQAWRADLGVDTAAWWPDGAGAGVRVYDIEYDLAADHEDLTNTPIDTLAGTSAGLYAYHGTAVVGIVAAADDGFGTTGGAPEADVVIVYPLDGDVYDLADAVLAAVDAGSPGDVILIEQQAQTAQGLAPATAEPAVWEAVALATAAGLVVVEPSGNGAVDLDHPDWAGWWSRDHDNGSILVAARDPLRGGWDGRSGFGSRVDVNGDGSRIVAPTTGGFRPDLFWPDEDDLQAYTSDFGGTSGAAAQVAGLVGAAQGVAKAVHGAPVPPRQLRAWLVASGHPQDLATGAESQVGVLPDLRRLLRSWLGP